MRVISNTAISLDGRINTGEDRMVFLGSRKDHEMMSRLRAQADAVLIGGATFRRWPQPLYAVSEPDADGATRPPLWNVVVTRRLELNPDAPYLKEPRIRPLFLTSNVPSEAGFPAPIETYSGATKDIPISWILEVLEKRGVKTLLVEAGGDLLYQFLAADALDEMFVTLCPRLIGGLHSPSLVDGLGFTLETMRRLRIQDVNAQGDEIFLHYRVEKGQYGVSIT